LSGLSSPVNIYKRKQKNGKRKVMEKKDNMMEDVWAMLELQSIAFEDVLKKKKTNK